MVSLKEAECIARNVIPDIRSCEDEPFAFLFYAGEEFFGDMVPNFNAAMQIYPVFKDGTARQLRSILFAAIPQNHSPL
ncbi:MAG: hypothetical protein IJU29_08535 [Oscillospiraceae bacterium]|nr:hypothetical protein [Oscillospiraceae bacterium]